MKIITWNCNRAFRKKFNLIADLGADIVVVQECEDPRRAGGEYEAWAGNHLWVGKNKNSGLGVFASKQISLQKLDWKDDNLEFFLPCNINQKFNLLAVWTKQANSPNFGYIGQLWKYMQLHKRELAAQHLLVCGDLNSNSIWDEWDRWWNHSDVVRELSEIDVQSMYHMKSGEEQGKETSPTFYLHRNREKPYHIDYAFVSRKLIGENHEINVGQWESWLTHSDHMPVIFDINV
jgi:exonuclease III